MTHARAAEPVDLSYEEARTTLYDVSDTRKASEAAVNRAEDNVGVARWLGLPDLSVSLRHSHVHHRCLVAGDAARPWDWLCASGESARVTVITQVTIQEEINVRPIAIPIVTVTALALLTSHGTSAGEVPIEKNAPVVPGHPLTSVVVTQCNLIVAVYMSMPDGKLLRFDSKATIPAGELLQMAYTATRSERVEVSCNENGEVGFKSESPV
jgi:hypothetical protein